jgi:murein DD-endopeptidase MepM/ murein hydrolase activator NlpD
MGFRYPGLLSQLFSAVVRILPFSILVGVFITPEVRADVSTTSQTSSESSLCPVPALSRLVRHRIASGETLASIAQQYNLIPATLMGFNPILRGGTAPVGAEILIPPYNGIRVEVPRGSSWRDVAKTYRVRADALYEVNGCQNAPRAVFVPGVNWSPTPATTTASSAANSPLTGYPLPAIAPITMAYGWQVDPAQGKVIFNSGVNLEAATGTAVLAVGAGTVAFAGEQAPYGKLIVINHAQGLQTRYAQLANISVRVGQQVRPGNRIGSIASADQSTSPSLHFEVRSNSAVGWVAQDPGTYIQKLRNTDLLRR